MISKVKQYISNIGYAAKLIFAASNKYFVIKMVLSMVSSVLPYLPLFLWRELINGLVGAVGGDAELLLDQIWLFAGLYCAVILVQRLLDTVSEFITFKYNDAINYYLDNVMIDKVASIDLAFFDSSDLNDRLRNSWRLIYATQNMVSFVFEMIQKAVRLFVSLSLLLTFSLWIVPVVVIVCIPSVLGDKKVKDMNYYFDKEYAKSDRKLTYYKEQFFNSSRSEVRLYHLKDYFSSLYTNVWKLWDHAIHEKNIKVCVINMGSLLLLAVSEVIVYILSVARLIEGKIGVGDVTYYVSLLSQFRSDFTLLCYRINMFGKNSKELNDVRAFVEMEPFLERSGTLIPSKNPKIEFKDVSFHYPDVEKKVLEHCSFVINYGEIVGLVGLNGSGKSTIVKLLCRFYDPTEGQILIDGIDSREYDIVKLRELFGVLFQDYVRYSFSLQENVALSDVTRMDDSDAICDACVESKVQDIIKNWENGIYENLTRRFDSHGKELSGGQWQRVSLARAFFRNAPVILLDEPSAALDPVAEHEIFEDFAKIAKGKSAVLISHRLSSIILCDNILVIGDGHIIEQGSHSELLQQNGEYARLFHLQASKYGTGRG